MASTSTGPRRAAYGEHHEQFGELWLPAPHSSSPRPLVALFHGGFWKAPYTRELMDDLARRLVDLDIAVWNVEYRRVGEGGGGGGWPMTYLDAAASLLKVEDLEGVDRTRVITCGHSAGGHLAVWAAKHAHHDARHQMPGPLAAISLAGVLDLDRAAEQRLGAGAVQALMGGSRSARAAAYDEASLLGASPAGLLQLLIHGMSDDVVPAAISTSYADDAVATGEAVELLLVDGTDHMSMIDPASPGWRLAESRILELVA